MNENENVTIPETETDYIQAINDLKANSVSREQYMKVKDENSRLLDALVKGETIEQTKTEPVDVDKLRREFFDVGQSQTYLQRMEKMLKIREELIAQGKPDPFVPEGKNIVATDEDIALANRVAEGFQHCVDVAEGDNLVFINEFQRITADTMPMRRKK